MKLHSIVERYLLTVIAIFLFVLLNTIYNIWVELTAYNLIRRSVATAATGTLLFGVAPFFRFKLQAIYLCIAWFVIGLLFITNLIYTKYAGGFLAASAVSYISQLPDTASSIWILFNTNFLIFFIPCFLFLVVGLISKKPAASFINKNNSFATIICIFVVVSAGYSYVAFKEYRQYGDVTRIIYQPIDSSEVVKKIGIINYNIVDAIHYFDRKKTLTVDEISYVKSQVKQMFISNEPELNAMTGILKGKNIVFLQLESFQQFVIDLKINNQEVTPHLNKLAKSSLQFTNFNYVIGPGTSSDAEFVMFTSLINLSNEAVVFEYPNNNYYGYPQVLRKTGYTTVAYHGDSKNFWNRANTFPTFGFQAYVTEESYSNREVVGYGISDQVFFKQTADKIAQLKRPFLAHVISLSSHSPFEIPTSERSLDLFDAPLSILQQNYLQAVNYTDRALGGFLDSLQRRGLLSSTAIFIVGDHEGFIFDKHDKYFAQTLGYKNGFDDLSYLRTKQVPFMILLPGMNTAERIDRPASHIDVYPTLMNLLGWKNIDLVMGVDLFGTHPAMVLRRSRGVGASIELAQQSNLTYISTALNGKPACYQGEEYVGIGNCKNLLNIATTRTKVSDLIIQGNRKDLLKLE